MGSASAIVLCLSYILGLLTTKVTWGGFLVLALGVCASLTVRRIWRAAPKRWVWLAGGLIGLMASLYFQVRVPVPDTIDVSRLVTSDADQMQWVVSGEVDSLPHITRSKKAQFWLNVQQVDSITGEPLTIANQLPTGKLYVTAPLQQARDLHPGQRVKVLGALYLPQPATNPGGFDFKEYLKQEGCFAGLRGQQLELLEPSSNWGLWSVQQRIVRSQAQWLSESEGPLVSSMVLGSRGVDLPYELKDQFVRVGLAHALAASGFQTSLILGVVLALTRRYSGRTQFLIGTGSLGMFVALTGLQPAVLRAAIMGFGGLVALALDRKLKLIGSLLVTATLLLVCNPLWIWNLGFQLSFLATLGLLVTVPSLTKRLDWLPSAVASAVAVPIAAYLWTLPLQLYAFGTLSPYSLVANLITTPLISLLSIVGMVSALAAMVWFPAGSAIAFALKWPTQALIAIVSGFSHLPGSAYAVGTISAVSAIVLYGLVGLTWLQPWWQRRWWVALVLGAGLVVIPVWQVRSTLYQVTILAASGQPVMLIQDGDRSALLNSGDPATADFAVLPLLQKEGINQIDWAIAPTRQLDAANGWSRVAERLPIHTLYFIDSQTAPSAAKIPVAVSPGQTATFGSTQMKFISTEPMAVELQMHQQTWLWLGAISTDQQTQLINSGSLPRPTVLWWSGQSLQPELTAALRPEVAIASGRRIHQTTADQLRDAGTQVYWTKQDGAIRWSSLAGFKTVLDFGENDSSAL